MALSKLPVNVDQFIPYVSSRPETPMSDLLRPFKEHEAKLREIYAQDPDQAKKLGAFANTVPVFAGNESNLKVRARDLTNEKYNDKFIMPLKSSERKFNGSPALVKSKEEFRSNFNIFSESSLADLDWNNVVAAGSSVVTSLMPLPSICVNSKRSTRHYYHDQVAPGSDVDLFLYGLSADEALEKIKQIENKVSNAVLQETTTVRTKNAFTIVSQYPTRHVQIVLRVYKSISEILTGFDVDCSCAAYDGKQVYATPRALAAYMTQINTVDLTRRSPSYENRLSKYSRRGFEVYWPDLNRDRIDPTIFERSFARTQGLARLLVLEKLPAKSDRDDYVDQRRAERARPQINRWMLPGRSLFGDIKETVLDEISEWVEEDELSNYHTVTIPYGPKIHAKKIEKLLYTKDLLLNAEWNKPKDRKVNLHRHPAFFGRVEDVVGDCCGFCPPVVTEEDAEVDKEESKNFISGDMKFIQDDPGRQAIGSFNPITDEDWTEMAYIGNNEGLFRAIVENDRESVKRWLNDEAIDVNRRDHTGRTPLQVAVSTSTLEIVELLIDHGARLIARLADGRTSLHLAAIRGDPEIMNALFRKSEQNQAEVDRLKEVQKMEQTSAKEPDVDEMDVDEDEANDEGEDDDEESDGSYVRVKRPSQNEIGNDIPDDNDQDPDVFDVDVLTWDLPLSALHYSIISGKNEVIKALVKDFSADVLLPVKLNAVSGGRTLKAIVPLALTLALPDDRQKATMEVLLQFGASAAQVDFKGYTVLQCVVSSQSKALDLMLDHDKATTSKAINQLVMEGTRSENPIISALVNRDINSLEKLIDHGAHHTVSFDDFIKAWISQHRYAESRSTKENLSTFRSNFDQPLTRAVVQEVLEAARRLIHEGASVNTISSTGYETLEADSHYSKNLKGTSLLDIVEARIDDLKSYDGYNSENFNNVMQFKSDEHYLANLQESSYKFWKASQELHDAKKQNEKLQKEIDEELEKRINGVGSKEKQSEVHRTLQEYKDFKQFIVSQGAKGFYELHPQMKRPSSKQKNKKHETTSRGKTYENNFAFSLPDLTENTQVAYEKLFEAAWNNDVETVRSLTLQSSTDDSNEKQKPLCIAAKDSLGLSPFSIAMFKGHRALACIILEICLAQFNPSADQNYRVWKMHSSDDSDDEMDENSAVRMPIFGHMMHDQLTFNDIDELSKQVKSTTHPVEMLVDDRYPIGRFGKGITSADPAKLKRSHSDFMNANQEDTSSKDISQDSSMTVRVERNEVDSLIEYAIKQDDAGTLNFLIDQHKRFSAYIEKKHDTEPVVKREHFITAINLGRTSILKQMILRTGLGAPFNDLIKESGVVVEEKPQYYQGLTVAGKKHKSWAQRRMLSGASESTTQLPMLLAAFKGSLESLEWFLSDTPQRLYCEFAQANSDDERVKNLSQAKGGVPEAIQKWLQGRSHLLLHAAILAPLNADNVFKYVLHQFPHLVNVKSPKGGFTPLLLAFALHRPPQIVQGLLEAGADQTSRDKEGRNITHALLQDVQAHTTPRSEAKSLERLKTLLGLVDPRLRKSLLLERCSPPGTAGSLTPLALWIDSQSVNYVTYAYYTTQKSELKMPPVVIEWFEILLSFVAEADALRVLDMVNGAGDTPLHAVTKKGWYPFAERILKLNPMLLYREDSTGRTPLEVAHDLFLSELFSIHHPFPYRGDGPYPLMFQDRTWTSWEGTCTRQGWSILDVEPEDLVKEKKEEMTPRESMYRMYQALDTQLRQEGKAKRKLVTLWEANEVADRLARKKKQERMEEERKHREEQERGGQKKDENVPDEVADWFNETLCRDE